MLNNYFKQEVNSEILSTVILKELEEAKQKGIEDIRTTIYYDLDPTIPNFLYLSKKGNYHLVINANINHNQQ